MIPGGIWAILTLYLPLFGGNLNRVETWLTTPVIMLFIAASLGCHILAHLWAAGVTGIETPSEMTILIFGDAAQDWSGIASEWREVIPTVAGPLANLLVAGLTYLLWHTQLNDFWGNIVLAISGFNFWLFLINLIPAFPMDGGRLVRSLLRGVPSTPALATRLLRYLGFAVVAVLIGWGVILLLQHSRFSFQNALIEVLFIMLLLDGLLSHPVAEKKEWAQFSQNVKFHFLRAVGVILLALILGAAATTLLLTNNGLDAPGVALPVESMVNVPAQYRHNHAGHFYLTTVISQAPILVGEWMLAQVDPAIVIVPPERVISEHHSTETGCRRLSDAG